MSTQWQVMLFTAYEKKCKVLMTIGHYASAIHFGRLSAVLDTGTFIVGLVLFAKTPF